MIIAHRGMLSSIPINNPLKSVAHFLYNIPPHKYSLLALTFWLKIISIKNAWAGYGG